MEKYSSMLSVVDELYELRLHAVRDRLGQDEHLLLLVVNELLPVLVPVPVAAEEKQSDHEPRDKAQNGDEPVVIFMYVLLHSFASPHIIRPAGRQGLNILSFIKNGVIISLVF